MTRRSKREPERALDAIRGSDWCNEPNRLIIPYKVAETDELYRSPDIDGEPVDPSETDAEPLGSFFAGSRLRRPLP